MMKIKLIILLWLCAIQAPLLHSECILIVSKESSITKVNSTELKRFFYGRTKMISGEKFTFVVQKSTNEIHVNFLHKFLNRTTQQFSKVWKKLIFTGKARNPKTLDSDEQVIEYISKNKNCIGYIDSKNLKDNIKKFEVEEN
jgi:hypothetical protein